MTAASRNRSNRRSDWKVISSDRLEFSIGDPDAVRSYPLQADAQECRACAMDDLLQALGVHTSAFRHFSPDLFRHQPSEDSTPRQRTRPDPLATFFESKVVPILERRPDIDPITVFHNLRNSEPEFKPNYHRSLVDLDRDVAAFWHAALTELDGMIARIRAFSPPRRAIEKLAAKAKRSTLEHGGERKMGVKLRYADSYEEPELKPRDFGDWLPKIDFAFFSIPSLTQASTSGIFSSMAESNPRSALGTEALFADWVFALSVSSDSRLTPLDKQTNASGRRRTFPRRSRPSPSQSTEPPVAALLVGLKRQASVPSRGPFTDTRCTTAASSQAREKPVFMRFLAREKKTRKE